VFLFWMFIIFVVYHSHTCCTGGITALDYPIYVDVGLTAVKLLKETDQASTAARDVSAAQARS